jgi:acetylornithine deacetylase/succinyl-diaminopimelate desuccinylase-like protein
VPLWLRLRATGNPSHGSRPQVQTSVTRLIRALYSIHNHQPIPRVLPAVDNYFKGLAEFQTGEFRNRFENMTEAVTDPDFLMSLQLQNPGLHGITRNTCSITVLQGSNKINVVPPEASAEIDCRLVPDQDPDEFIRELQTVINDPLVKIEKIMAFSPAVSTTDTDLYRAIVSICTRRFPGAKVLPAVETGFTDSHFMRDLGITCYGFDPSLIPAEDAGGVHGNNERISIENVKRGVGMMLEILEEVVY